MKLRRVDLSDAREPRDVLERVVRVRTAEAADLAFALQTRDKRDLHALRIACKRLRYALERFEPLDSSLQPAAERLAQIQDALGEAHDRDVLLGILPPTMPETERRLLAEREALIDRACALWTLAQRERG